MIKRALDAGAHGIMTPMCHNEVRAVFDELVQRITALQHYSTDHRLCAIGGGHQNR